MSERRDDKKGDAWNRYCDVYREMFDGEPCLSPATIIEFAKRERASVAQSAVAPMIVPQEQFDAAKARVLCDWPTGEFRIWDDPDPHKPCFLVCPDGAMVGFSHHNGEGVDKARVQFIADACNAALAPPSATALRELAERCRPAVAHDARLREREVHSDKYAHHYKAVLATEAERAAKLLDDIDAILGARPVMPHRSGGPVADGTPKPESAATDSGISKCDG